MAANPASFIQAQTLALLQQQILSQISSSGSGFSSSIADALLAPHAKTGRQISAEAITGRMRSDAGMLRQSSRNVGEGESISRLSQNSTEFIADSLTKMRDLAQSVADGSAPVDASTQFGNLAQGIKGRIESTAYNGISLLDKTKWGTESRLTPSLDGETAKLSLQIGDAAQDLTLRDMSDLKNLGSLDLSSSGAAATTAVTLSSHLGDVTGMAKGYKSQADSFASEGQSLNRQADILSETAKRAIAAPGRSTRDILMDLLTRDQGHLFDDSL